MSLSDISKLTASMGFTERNDPFSLFGEWLKEAEKSEPNDANAMALATADEEGLPNVRMVLLKDFDEKGFVFYTNFESQKGQEILGTMKAALVFHWKSLRRQVRVRGLVEEVSSAEMLILRHVRETAALGPGRRSNRVRSKHGLRSKRPWR